MKIIAIDPADQNSAYVIIDDDYNIIEKGKVPNIDLMKRLQAEKFNVMVIEMIASYGMPVGKTVFETCVWIGRFYEKAKANRKEFIYRSEEKMNLCHNMKARDSNIRQALIDRFAKFDFKNGKGTKKEPDWFYGFSADIWAAYAVGVTYLDKTRSEIK